MSTKRDTRYAAKRRAEVRKRNREVLRYVGVYFFIAMLVIGTISTVFVAQVGAPGTALPTPTPTSDNALRQLVTQADTYLTSGSYDQAIPLYNAYLAQFPEDAEVHFKLGKAYVDAANPAPDYVAGLSHLQRALNINPAGTFVAEAQALIGQYAPAANETAAAQASAVAITGTATVTGTISIVSTPGITGTGTVTGTVPTPGLNTDASPTAPITATAPITP
jgi:tetratricopeptide (TPR) repeat protein